MVVIKDSKNVDQPMTRKHRILIAEDHALFREGIRALLEAGGGVEIVGETGDGAGAIRLFQELLPDLVLMDLDMPKVDGIRATKAIKKDFPKAKVVVLTMHSAEEHVYLALRAGADGYVLKDAPGKELLMAMESVLAGKSFVSPGISGKLIRGYIQGKKAEASLSPWDALTAREREVLQLVAEDKKNKEIAELLFISVKTVEKHRFNLMKKLGLHNAQELKAFAASRGLVQA